MARTAIIRRRASPPLLRALAVRVHAGRSGPRHPLTVVVGASGTGKSSVVKAGLLAELRRTEPDTWRILPPFRPGKSPLASLAGLSLPGERKDDLGATWPNFGSTPTHWPSALVPGPGAN